MTVTIQMDGAPAWEATLEGESGTIRLTYQDIANYVMVRGRAAAGGFMPLTLDPFKKKDDMPLSPP